MFKEVKKSIQWGEDTLTLETGKVARQADGSVIATLYEENRTVVPLEKISKVMQDAQIAIEEEA